ncbi:MAG TPA: hypothetical protein VEI25_12185, partial [Paraburkholderia sp.]|nr:hypothetical protein [Paraburkholderia sp.]
AESAARLRARVRRYLLPRCLLTTRLHVVAPDCLYVGIGCSVALQAGVSLAAASRAIREALEQRFGYDPQTGTAPALGAPLNLSALARVIDDVPGVDYVDNVTVLQLSTEPHATAHADAGLGVQIGVRSTLGHDTRIGGALPYYEERLIRDSGGALASVKLKPWEWLRLSVAPDGIHEIGETGRTIIESQGGRDE